MRGLSLQKLASMLGETFNKQLLHRLESGVQMPNSEQLTKLSNALGQSTDYFLKPLRGASVQVNYRKAVGLGKKTTDRIIELAGDYFERYSELEDLLGIDQQNTDLQGSILSVDQTNVMEEAINIRTNILNVGLTPISNIMQTLDGCGVKVLVINSINGAVLDGSFDGFSTIINGNAGCIILNGNPKLPLVYKRFALLREFAHLYLDLNGIDSRAAGKLCNTLAGALLIPKHSLIETFGAYRTSIHFNELKLFKRTVGAPVSVILRSLYSNGIISQSYFNSLMIEYNLTYKKDEAKDFHGREQSDRFEQLLLRALVTGVISESKAAALMNMKVGQFLEYLDKMFDADSSN